MVHLSCFKAYDVRGKVPEELDELLAYHIGRALAEILKPGAVVVGRDVRLSSPGLAESLSKGLMDSGMDVLDIGLCGTEQVYFSTAHLKASGGVMVTASHNPAGYNGMKFVREESKPISGDTGLKDIEALAVKGEFKKSARRGGIKTVDTSEAYINHILSYIDPSSLPPFKVLVNPGNGCAGLIIDKLEERLSLSTPTRRFAPPSPAGGEGNKEEAVAGRRLAGEGKEEEAVVGRGANKDAAARRGINFVKIFHEPDGSFPHGVPNPLLPQNRDATAKAVLESGADIGVAWDGDFDRCFLFDEKGSFIEGYYIVGLLAEAMLSKHPGAKIIHDPRLTWNTHDIVQSAGGIPIMSKAGHAFMKERMRAEDAVYGGEMSAHHYFKGFSYCDSGMIPWLLVLERMASRGQKLSELVEERERLYPVSGEINREIADPAAALKRVEEHFAPGALSIDHTDGVSVEFPDWRFNLRMSNTEPLVRLNVEARGNTELMRRMTDKILSLL